MIDAPEGAGLLGLDVYDARGRRVVHLAGPRALSGPATITWDGRDVAGVSVPSGLYFVRARTTLGDRSLEREVLQLFDRQAGLLLARMQSRDAAAMAALAHTLKGSAASIGATDVMLAAAAVEHAGAGEREAALDRLAAAIDEACAAIAGLLRES